jgi:hypothetical protein
LELQRRKEVIWFEIGVSFYLCWRDGTILWNGHDFSFAWMVESTIAGTTWGAIGFPVFNIVVQTCNAKYVNINIQNLFLCLSANAYWGEWRYIVRSLPWFVRLTDEQNTYNSTKLWIGS